MDKDVPLKKPGRRRRAPPGASPGTLIADPDAPKPALTVIAYGPEGLVEEKVRHPGAVRDSLERWPVTWVNVDGLGDVETIRQIGELFCLHRLALEDVVNVHQRAKVEEYGDHFFIIGRMAASTESPETEQVSLFVGGNFLISFQERRGDCFEPVRQRIRQKRGRIRMAGPDYLAYALVDAVIDGYFPLLEGFGARLEVLQDEILSDPGPDTVKRVHAVKRDLLTVRRAIWPHREAINQLVREESPLIKEETQVHLRDCYDHTVQIIDMVETYRELASGLMEFYLSSVSNRMNEVMKVLTIIATIFIPLTFIAGIYGMNFNSGASPWNMPETNWRWGYPACLFLMVAVVIAMVIFFRRRRWL